MADQEELTQQLIDAIENESKEEIDAALAAGADINSPDPMVSIFYLDI